jgi:NADH-quinone oxidoreductase subunit A
MIAEELIKEYLPIIIFMAVAFGFSAIVLLASVLAGRRRPYKGKLAPYECGFDAFSDTRSRFDVRFYLVAILFIIFDLEIAFLFPWAISLGNIGIFGFWSMAVFVGVLAVGLIYEWKKGALDWE